MDARDEEIRELKLRLEAGEKKKSDRGIPAPLQWAASIAVGILLLFIFAALMAPSSGNSDYDKCVRNKGAPSWRGSLGVSLEDFCKVAAGLTARIRDERDHPEKY